MPVLSQFPKGIIFDLPTQVSQVANDGTGIAIQGPRHHPNPVLFFLLLYPLFGYAFTLRPLFPDADHAHWPGLGIGDAHARHIPNLNSSALALHHLGWLLPSRQSQRLLVGFITFLFEHGNNRPAKLLSHGLEKRSIGIPGVHHDHIKKPCPYCWRIRRNRRKAAAHSSSPWRIGSKSKITLNSGPLNCA